ncbi:16S rRNA (adenine(1518)-N(6)/adenine(1519)-N(6))-dimethyltransferase RsmA [Peptoniphilus sp. oral taxon 386]|uniref:16S rRNA (adenine(1518)-N(6)/adenine(1519)-N(6))- dimethyltransferase RsmA n=1 Tax=Peptoniphilus sp. oral taxon 386 TaxID=652713 RepID=UPI0001DA9FD5|nr:16S rRNA (adenine(1518)-N(6)/adenine(1519)-N(6))-dimethyltransferase RsmA [Peptoniphilus sp. oral taxon 386]EFI41593.1 dimethyladenosine transferase [Peptoniphilus sp. oral taxon 386 str. F0131]
MERLYKPARLIELLNKYGFRFSKSLGQNFLIDGNIVRKIVDSAEISSNDNVLEIGPGVGTLTEELCLRAKKVVSIEIDNHLKELLKESLPYENVKIIFNDVLKTDLKKFTEQEFGGETFKVVANLPYYVTTPIISKLIEEDLNIESITVMIQKEVANRFSASPSTKDYGSLSVFIQFYSDVKYEFTVPKNVFMPKPNVDSAVVNLKIKKDLPDIDRDKLFKVVRAAFSKRRKTLINALSSYGFNIDKNEILKALSISNIDEKRRAETLSSEEFIVLSINLPSINIGGE